MTKPLLSIALAIAIAGLAPGQSPMHMSFANTSAATVLKVIATRTHTNIVFAGKEASPISLDITVNTAEDAIRAAVSAAGLEYRKVNDAFIVASAQQMRSALQPYATKAQFNMDPGIAAQIVKTVQDAYPDASVQAAGDKLTFVGIPADVREARGLIDELRLRATQDAPVNEVVAVTHSNPADIAKAVSALYPDVKAASTGDEKGGAVSLSGPLAKVQPAAELAAKMDSAIKTAPQEEFRVYDVKYMSTVKLEDFMSKAAKEVQAYVAPESYSPKRALFNPLGAAISSASGTNSTSGGISGSTGTNGSTGGSSTGTGTGTGTGGGMEEEKGSRARRLVLRGTPERLEAVIRMLESIDVKPQQVFVEVKVLETSPSLEDNEGFTWNWSPIQFFEAPVGASATSGSTVTRPLQGGRYSRAPFNFGSILTAQIQSGEAKVLANPKIGVTDNDGASIFIGDTIRAEISQAGALGAQTVQIEEFPVGIILLIHPRINADGNITMHVNPVISAVTAITNGIPQTSSREAETTMIVKDGETIVLGGLIQDNFSKTVTAVPYLSKLPLIGELFKSTNTSKKRTDVIITITTHIMKDGETAK